WGKGWTWWESADQGLFVKEDAGRDQPGARRVAITGTPGAGKSSLLTKLLGVRSLTGNRLGILAIDPSSPKSGGAILGDRIRMDDLEDSDNIYVRSLGSRAAGDGLADNLYEMMNTMDAHHFDEVFVETVGVGQVGYGARELVDTVVLVVIPESGDMVQAMKSGISEMADIIVVNKADLPGAKRMLNDINHIAAVNQSSSHDNGWLTPVMLVSNTSPDSVAELSRTIDAHQAHIAGQKTGRARKVARARYRLRQVVDQQLAKLISQTTDEFFAAPLNSQVSAILAQLHGSQDNQETRDFDETGKP
ncbi:ArgK/MeaB family GTPase, partial [Profundibacter sp.]